MGARYTGKGLRDLEQNVFFSIATLVFSPLPPVQCRLRDIRRDCRNIWLSSYNYYMSCYILTGHAIDDLLEFSQVEIWAALRSTYHYVSANQ